MELLKVMTYNIHCGIGMDNHYALNRIIDVVGRENPDVVALQEVDRKMPRTGFDDQPAVIAKALGMHYQYSVNTCLEGGQYGNATLSKFSITSKKHHDLSFNPRLKLRFRRRGTLRTDIEVGREQLHIFNVHLGLGIRERIHQRRKLLSDSILFHNEIQNPIVILGDFNDRPIPVVHTRLRNHFRDAFKMSGKNDGATFYKGLIKFKLDHIYLSDHLYPVETYVLDTPLSRLASDHLPLISNVKFKN